MKWEKVRLGDVADSCLGKMLDQAKNKGEYQPYLANVDVRWGYFNLDNLSEMRFEDDEQERYGLKYGDLVICEGGEPGRCAIWKDQVPNMKIQKALHRVRVHDCLDYRFLYYWFLLAGKTGALEQYFTGATIKHMPGEKLKNIIIDMPPKETQQHIADILWDYDILIESNQKQINLLEEAAQRLYKEWFVDLRFPGHEATPIVDGRPKGWAQDKVSHFVSTFSGGTPSRLHPEYYINGTNLWVKTQELSDGFIFDTEEKITDEAIDSSSTKKIQKGSILMAMYGATIGKLGIAARELTCNQACCVFDLSKSEYATTYLYLWLKDNRDFFISQGKGAAQPNLSQVMIKNFEILIPSNDVLVSFSKLTNVLFERIGRLHLQKMRLAEARDRLLPKLMSREIEV